MDTLVTCPLTSQRNVELWPRWIVVGSAVNCATPGAAGGGGGGGGVTTGAGGFSATGFFLHPTPTTASDAARQMMLNFRLLNMNFAS